ncbi:MAG: SGNH/GDSL hydrolase family protein [Ferruginibacter sp.]
MKTYSYLALGDSYTIGEQVPLADSFPYQAVQLLRKADISRDNREHLFATAEIIAKTGWTTDELTKAIGQTIFLPNYDIVSLLVGVNDQYRGRPVAEFKTQFELLLQMAIQFAGGVEKNVYVLSIPDWGVTPFANDRDIKKIATEIDAYNEVCEITASSFKTHFINITDEQRKDAINPEYLAADGLHPSGQEYKKWALRLAQLIWLNLAR